MACNWHVITCHYMHYMSLHAIEDANAVRTTWKMSHDGTGRYILDHYYYWYILVQEIVQKYVRVLRT